MRVKRNLILLFMLLGNTVTAAAASNIETQGDVLAVLVPVSAFATTYYYDDEEGRKQFYKSLLATTASTHVLKYTVYKPRPDGSDNLSFPSGHTSAAFQGASFIHHRYGFRKAILPYVASIYVGYTRVEANRHDWTDVAAGAALGVISNWYFANEMPGQGLALYGDRNSIGLRYRQEL